MERIRTGQDRVVGPADRDGGVRRVGVPAGPDTPRPVDRRDRTRRALARPVRLDALRSLRTGGSAGLPRRGDVGSSRPVLTPFEAIRNDSIRPLPGAGPRPARRRPCRAAPGELRLQPSHRAVPRASPRGVCGLWPGRARASSGDGEHGRRVEGKAVRVRGAAITRGDARAPRGAALRQAGGRGQKPASTELEADHASATIVEE